jgi:hypothetical protein
LNCAADGSGSREGRGRPPPVGSTPAWCGDVEPEPQAQGPVAEVEARPRSAADGEVGPKPTTAVSRDPRVGSVKKGRAQHRHGSRKGGRKGRRAREWASIGMRESREIPRFECWEISVPKMRKGMGEFCWTVCNVHRTLILGMREWMGELLELV